jgi:hypothetical protein
MKNLFKLFENGVLFTKVNGFSLWLNITVSLFVYNESLMIICFCMEPRLSENILIVTT